MKSGLSKQYRTLFVLQFVLTQGVQASTSLEPPETSANAALIEGVDDVVLPVSGSFPCHIQCCSSTLVTCACPYWSDKVLDCVVL